MINELVKDFLEKYKIHDDYDKQLSLAKDENIDTILEFGNGVTYEQLKEALKIMLSLVDSCIPAKQERIAASTALLAACDKKGILVRDAIKRYEESNNA